MFWPIKNSGEVLNKLKDIGYQAISLSTYDFSTLYKTIPHNLYPPKTGVRNDEPSLSTPARNIPVFCYLNIIWKNLSLKQSLTFSIYQPIKKYLLYSRQ